LDPQTRVAYARAAVDNSEGLLRAEMYVTVQLPHLDNEEAAVEIPASAVFFQDGKYYVVAQIGQHKFDLREVTIVHEGSAGVSVVVRGIRAGQQVVSDVSRSRMELVQAGGIAASTAE
jgi:multidrug efflux pump subunit AcrA (membrane-fusion protein)